MTYIIGSGGGGKGGGGGGRTPHEDKDNLDSKLFGKVLDLILNLKTLKRGLLVWDLFKYAR